MFGGSPTHRLAQVQVKCSIWSVQSSKCSTRISSVNDFQLLWGGYHSVLHFWEKENEAMESFFLSWPQTLWLTKLRAGVQNTAVQLQRQYISHCPLVGTITLPILVGMGHMQVKKWISPCEKHSYPWRRIGCNQVIAIQLVQSRKYVHCLMRV